MQKDYAVADRILTALQAQGPLDRTAIRDLFMRSMPRFRIDRALTILAEASAISVMRITYPRGGRPRTIIHPAEERKPVA